MQAIDKKNAALFQNGILLSAYLVFNQAVLLYLSYDSLECFGMVHRQIGQHLAVDFDAGLVKATPQL